MKAIAVQGVRGRRGDGRHNHASTAIDFPSSLGTSTELWLGRDHVSDVNERRGVRIDGGRGVYVTLFRGARDTTPIGAPDLPWSGLVAEFDQALHETAAEKTALPAFGPYRLRDGAPRGDANVVERTLIALDSDDGTAPERYVERLEALGVAGYIYTTATDTAARRKCRVVSPLAAPLPPDDARRVMVAFAERLGMRPGCGVERTLDDSRLYFIGHVDGTPERERWIVDGQPIDPSTLPAPVLAWAASGARKAAPRVELGENDHVTDSEIDHAIELARTLAPSVAGEGGEAALFKATREIAAVLGPNVDAIRIVLDVYNGRALPPWDSAKLDREAERAAGDQHTTAAKTLRRWLRRTWEKEHAPRLEAVPPPGAEPAENLTILGTAQSHSVFVLDPRSESYVEVSRENLIGFLRTSGAAHVVEMEGPRGGALPPQAIIDRNITIIKDAVADFRAPAAAIYDRASRRMLLGIECPKIDPRVDERVALWLEALAGDEIAAVLQWIASTRQDRIHRLATALVLIGPHGVGKTVFAQVCASLWGAAPVELSNVAAQFNAAQSTCPIVLDDECECLARRELTTEQFRVLVQRRDRRYEPKGKERRMLLGAQRFILTANDVTDLKFANALGRGAVDALAERVTRIEIDDDQAEHARAMLDAVRLDSGDLDWPALAGHFRAIQDVTPIPDERTRFLGQSANKVRARAAVVANALELDRAAYDRIGPVACGASTIPGPVFVSGGALWAQPIKLAEALAAASPVERWDAARVQRALGPIRGRRSYVWHNGQSIRAWELDADRVAEYCRLDPDAVARTLHASLTRDPAAS